MDLYLIRHGETVDNVAGLYAGVRDSVLTNHGVDQASRLGDHFAKTNTRFTHVFSSPLTRAYQTAQYVCNAQPKDRDKVAIVRVQDLIEQNFGYYEGKSFKTRIDAKKSGREAHRDRHCNDPGFIDVESKESLSKRADDFLDQHLIPLLEAHGDGMAVVAVVSHGMLLSHLWRRLLPRLPLRSISIDDEISAAKGPIVLDRLGGWSNTGYLELKFRGALDAIKASASKARITDGLPQKTSNSDPDVSTPVDDSPQAPSKVPSRGPLCLTACTLSIVAIDRKDHLVGLKRQRGGIGSSAHDAGQRTLDGFFSKRQRTS